MKPRKFSNPDVPQGQGDGGELTEGQKAMLAAKQKKVRRGVSIAPSPKPEGEDEITIEPVEEGASQAAEDEFVAEDAPLNEKPRSGRSAASKPQKAGRVSPPIKPKTSQPNRK
jgi:hypothetical protein